MAGAIAAIKRVCPLLLAHPLLYLALLFFSNSFSISAAVLAFIFVMATTVGRASEGGWAWKGGWAKNAQTVEGRDRINARTTRRGPSNTGGYVRMAV